jgi:enoyl-CoA hydratase/carnithine racemase
MPARPPQFDAQLAGLEPRLQVVELGAAEPRPVRAAPGNLVIGVRRDSRHLGGVDRAGLRDGAVADPIDPCPYDLLLSSGPAPSRAWVGVPAATMDAVVAQLEASFAAQPLAAGVLGQVLRVGESLSIDDALLVESLAFSTLLAGAGFRDWLRARAVRVPTPTVGDATARIRCTREGDVLTLHLANPSRRNAFDAAMRDALVEALAAACDDPTLQRLELRGDGPDFSAGGDLREFGSATDPAVAHAIRTLRSPARLLGLLAARSKVHLHGACVGAGIEVPAAAGRIVASPDTRLWLPELPMGLIPGAGGTATIARRIGRHRLLFWALSGQRLSATTALDWGLVDELRSAP